MNRTKTVSTADDTESRYTIVVVGGVGDPKISFVSFGLVKLHISDC